MKEHQENELNQQQGSTSPEVVMSVPKKPDVPTKSVSNSSNNVKYDKNGKQISPKATEKTNLDKKKIAIIAGAVVLAIAVIVGIVCLCVGLNSGKQDDETGIVDETPEEPKDPEPLENTDPLEAEPDEIDPVTYQVAAYKPRLLSIPSLGLANVPVTEVGWLNGNQLGSPKSTRVAGWFYRSSIPGELGPAIINAHGGDLGTGIFKTLPQIKMGDDIIIEMGDGRKFTYTVGEIAFKKLGAEANEYMNIAFQVLVPGVPSLTLITCTGNWLPAQNTYDQRLYVRAALKQ